MNKRPFHHLIFDLDGTLVDSEVSVLKTWAYTLESYGQHWDWQQLRWIIGSHTAAAMERLGVHDPAFEEQWIANYSRFAGETRFFEGVLPLLEKLQAAGYPLGIVTARERAEMELYFPPFHLEEHFGCILCADATLLHKPHPEPLLRYAQLTGADLAHSLYVGDRPGDMACANSAGAASGLALWNGSGLTCPEARYRFSSLQDLENLVLR